MHTEMAVFLFAPVDIDTVGVDKMYVEKPGSWRPSLVSLDICSSAGLPFLCKI